jgi:hypothetical protein
MMNWKECATKWSWPVLNFPCNYLEGLGKARKNINQDDQSLGPDPNLRLPEYEAGVIITAVNVSVVYNC